MVHSTYRVVQLQKWLAKVIIAYADHSKNVFSFQQGQGIQECSRCRRAVEELNRSHNSINVDSRTPPPAATATANNNNNVQQHNNLYLNRLVFRRWVVKLERFNSKTKEVLHVGKAIYLLIPKGIIGEFKSFFRFPFISGQVKLSSRHWFLENARL
jgi:hypothetical protein